MSLVRAAFGRRGRIFAAFDEKDLVVIAEGLRLIWRLVESETEASDREEVRLRAWALLSMVKSERARREAERAEEAKKKR